MKVFDEKGLGEALKNGEDTIEIQINLPLAGKVIRIKATNNVAWAVAIGAIGIAVLSLLPIPDPAKPIEGATAFALAPVVVATLGVDTAASAIMIAVASGGVASLNKLRKYRMIKEKDKIILKRR